jgi:hypothetical protein
MLPPEMYLTSKEVLLYYRYICAVTVMLAIVRGTWKRVSGLCVLTHPSVPFFNPTVISITYCIIFETDDQITLHHYEHSSWLTVLLINQMANLNGELKKQQQPYVI